MTVVNSSFCFPIVFVDVCSILAVWLVLSVLMQEMFNEVLFR